MKHQAIYNTHPEVKTIIDNEDNTVTCYDANGNIVNINQADIEAQFPIIELDNAMSTLRAKRNKLLQDTDHYALSDQTLSDDMRTYRQSLRDITNGLTTVEDVNSVTWPTKPGA